MGNELSYLKYSHTTLFIFLLFLYFVFSRVHMGQGTNQMLANGVVVAVGILGFVGNRGGLVDNHEYGGRTDAMERGETCACSTVCARCMCGFTCSSSPRCQWCDLQPGLLLLLLLMRPRTIGSQEMADIV
jgi:hypothetical protein